MMAAGKGTAAGAVIRRGTEIEPADLAGVIRIHREQLSQGFLSSLGDRALRLMFSFARESARASLFTATVGGSNEVVGFLLGTPDIGSFYKDFLRRKSLAAFFVLGPKLLAPRRLRKLTETLLYPYRKETDAFPKAELLDVAVTGARQGSGIAQNLFHAFVDELRELGIRELKITTGESLKQAHRFYEKLGAVKAGEIEVHRGRKTFVYVYPISGAIDPRKLQ